MKMKRGGGGEGRKLKRSREEGNRGVQRGRKREGGRQTTGEETKEKKRGRGETWIESCLHCRKKKVLSVVMISSFSSGSAAV